MNGNPSSPKYHSKLDPVVFIDVFLNLIESVSHFDELITSKRTNGSVLPSAFTPPNWVLVPFLFPRTKCPNSPDPKTPVEMEPARSSDPPLFTTAHAPLEMERKICNLEPSYTWSSLTLVS